MYIKSVRIKNIRSIENFEMEFSNPAGWHVLIGDNGAGKSTVIKSIATALVGPDEIMGITPNWNEWLMWNEKKGNIRLTVIKESNIDQQTTKIESPSMFSGVAGAFPIEFSFEKNKNGLVDLVKKASSGAHSSVWSSKVGWFSAGFGPFRRFTGGAYEKEKIFENPRLQRLAAHLSLFGEDVALTEATKWLMNLQYKVLEKSVSDSLLENLNKLINSDDFLPHNAKLVGISSDGVLFEDGSGAEISVDQMSDGYRSILSLTFEMLRQLIRVYGEEKVFQNIKKDNFTIDLPGVVLIDEIDAHLHPTWQTRIGQWFTKYFPKIQFIVTTHSPLVCRACGNGTIWRLTAPGIDLPSGEVKGVNRDRLIFGNVLDAYGTEIFGEDVSQSEDSEKMLKELAALNVKSFKGTISDDEKKRIVELQKILPTA